MTAMRPQPFHTKNWFDNLVRNKKRSVEVKTSPKSKWDIQFPKNPNCSTVCRQKGACAGLHLSPLNIATRNYTHFGASIDETGPWMPVTGGSHVEGIVGESRAWLASCMICDHCPSVMV